MLAYERHARAGPPRHKLHPARHTFGDGEASAEGERLQGVAAGTSPTGAGVAGGEGSGAMSVTGIVDRLDR